MIWKNRIYTWAAAIMLIISGCQDAGNEGREPIQPPTAKFSANNTNCKAPCQVDFNNLVGNADDYLWTFGDGDTSSKANPSHIFEEEGLYSVSLKVSNVSGATTIVKQIKIDSGYRKAGIESITFSDYPETDTNSTPWDPNSPPDLYVEFLQDSGNLLISNTQVFPNSIDTLNMPRTWKFGPPLVMLTNFDSTYTVRLIDQDSNSPDRTMFTYTLPTDALNTAPDPYPEKVPIRNEDDEAIGNIRFIWSR